VLGGVSGTGEVAWALPPRADPSGPRSSRADRGLVRAAQRGDTDALERLFRRHWGMAHRAAYLVVHDAAAAEDIAQEAFLAALRALERFDRRRPFAPWLHRIVVNRAIDHARARAVRREVALTETAVVLRHLLEYTPGEIAALLDLPRGTVNSRLRRGLDALAVRLAEDHEHGASRTPDVEVHP
jgi:RNA polymerase sigma-70 factor (ECF subfamily)